MEKNKNLIIGIACLIILAMLVIPSLNIGKFAVGDSSVSRTGPSSASPGSTFTITYTATSSSSESWGVSIVDSISGGCQFTNGKTEYKDVILSDGSTTRTMSVKALSGASSCTFTGDYKFGTDTIVNFPNKVVTIGTCTDTCASLGYTSGTHTICGVSVECGTTCTSHSTSACLSNDIYWYDSCGEVEELKEDCGTKTCSSGACVIGGTCTPHDSYKCSGGDVYYYNSCGEVEELKEDCGTKTCSSGACVTDDEPFDLNKVIAKFKLGEKEYSITILHLIFGFVGLFAIKMLMSK